MSDQPADPRREAVRAALQRQPAHRVIPVKAKTHDRQLTRSLPCTAAIAAITFGPPPC